MRTKNVINCRTVQKNFLDLIEGSLDHDTSKGVEKHFETCSKCKKLFENVQMTYASLDKLPKNQPGPFFANRVMERFQKLEVQEKSFSYRFVQVLQPIAASILLIMGIGSGIYLGENLATSKSVVSTQGIAKESMESYASEIYLDDLGEQSIDNLINNE